MSTKIFHMDTYLLGRVSKKSIGILPAPSMMITYGLQSDPLTMEPVFAEWTNRRAKVFW